MPTPAFTPGAKIFPINLTGPAFAGLNTEKAGSILDKAWATTLDNMVFDGSGRPASRRGMLSITTTPAGEDIKQVFEYYKADGTSEVIYSTDSDIYKNTTTPASIDGTLTITDGNIKFVNFNDKVIALGIGTGGIPAVRTTGDFADITVNSGTAPTSGIGTAAFGRVWAVDTDGKTLRYSALLDETRWDSADGGGSIDYSKVWPSGQDDIIAVEEFGGDLVVFGSNNTVVMTDGAGSSLGIAPESLYVSDTIPGQGAISQFAMCRAVGDLWIATPTGIIGLQRELVQKSTPLTNISQNVQSAVIAWVANEADANNIDLVYSPKEAFVVCNFPTSGTQVVFDTRSTMPDGTYRATTWSADLQTMAYIRGSRDLYGALKGTTGEVIKYAGNEDDGASYAIQYESGWLDLGEELNVFLKFVKRLTSFLFVSQNVVVTHKVNYDFGTKEYSIQRSATGGRVPEFGSTATTKYAEWGTNGSYNLQDPLAVPATDYAEYAGGVSLRTIDAPGKGGGQYIQVGLTIDTNSGEFAMQQINLYAKIGRHAT